MLDSGFARSELARIRDAGLCRSLRYGTARGSRITMGGKELVNLCSNDYLGMPPTPIRAGQLQSSSRLVSGNDESYLELEGMLARHKSKRAALVYPTGYMANLGVITALAGKGDVIFSDELNHASIIDACRLSGAKTIVYRHNDADDLRKKSGGRARKKFLVTEGIFSMDGDYASLGELCEVAEGRGMATILDDAHGDFAVGRGGRGAADALGAARKIDVYTSSLSKALGSFGGYAAAGRGVIDLCVNKSRQFIYTSALPAGMVRHAAARMKRDSGARRQRLAQNARALAAGISGAGFDARAGSHIIPVMMGNEGRAVAAAGQLYRAGVFVQPIRYPTVKKGQARLRVSATAWLSQADIAESVGAFEAAGSASASRQSRRSQAIRR